MFRVCTNQQLTYNRTILERVKGKVHPQILCEKQQFVISICIFYNVVVILLLAVIIFYVTAPVLKVFSKKGGPC